MILIAAGHKLGFTQKDIKINGHAVETRVYAEDASRKFLPSTGFLKKYIEPKPRPGLRIDTGVCEGSEISMYYDPMISKMITWAKTRQEAIDMKPHQIDKIIDDSLDLISHHLKLHNIRLLKEIQRDLPLVDVDENQMKQALLALYVNAVEAMENEGTMSIKTQQNRSQGSISIFIGDTGKGIPEKVKSQIFEPFFTTKNAVKGVGLGLSAVYAIIHKHQGEISVESEVDKGTTFEIRIFLKTSRIPGP